VSTKTSRTTADPADSKPDLSPDLNLCLVRGECSAPPELRTLASGSRLAVLAVRVRTAGAAATSVPVAVWEPTARVEELEAGTEVVVLGRVVRRFFRTAGGGPGSRVEVHAELVAPAGDRRKLTQALRRAERVLDQLASG
jgi:hypothetical protein